MRSEAELFCACRARLGEGVCWDSARQSLWWVDIIQGKIFEAKLNQTNVRELQLPSMIGAVAPTSRATLIGAMRDGIYEIDPAGGALTLFASGLHDPAVFRFNDAKIDPAGRLWAGTLGLHTQAPNAHLYRIDRDRTIRSMLQRITISNGIAWSPGGDTMYYIDTATCCIAAFDFDVSTGGIGKRRIAIAFSPDDGLPDGCCMDVEGRLWVAHWGAGKVTCWNLKTQTLAATLHVPVDNVTSCAFGGPNLEYLFVSTARNEEKTSASEPHAGGMFVANVGVRGLPTTVFEMSD